MHPEDFNASPGDDTTFFLVNVTFPLVGTYAVNLEYLPASTADPQATSITFVATSLADNPAEMLPQGAGFSPRDFAVEQYGIKQPLGANDRFVGSVNVSAAREQVLAATSAASAGDHQFTAKFVFNGLDMPGVGEHRIVTNECTLIEVSFHDNSPQRAPLKDLRPLLGHAAHLLAAHVSLDLVGHFHAMPVDTSTTSGAMAPMTMCDDPMWTSMPPLTGTFGPSVWTNFRFSAAGLYRVFVEAAQADSVLIAGILINVTDTPMPIPQNIGGSSISDAPASSANGDTALVALVVLFATLGMLQLFAQLSTPHRS